MTRLRALIVSASLPLAFALAPAQTARAQTPLPPIHPLGPIIATAAVPIGSIFYTRPLTDGRLVVNDAGFRKLLILDSTLQTATTLFDSLGTAQRAYQRPAGPIFAFPADSTLFVDPTALSILIVDPAGKIARQVAMPTGTGWRLPTNDAHSTADPHGRLIYAVQMRAPTPTQPASRDNPSPPHRPDSAVILAVNLANQHVDTLAITRLAKTYPDKIAIDSTAVRWPIGTENIFPVTDGWAMLSDGTLAVVRAGDFHVDWISPTGTTTASAPLPHIWRRLSDSAKAAIVDSARQTFLAHPIGLLKKPGPDGTVVSHQLIEQPPPASEIPDYPSPFTAILADADDNLWIREPTSPETATGAVYDIVNRAGVMTDRIRIPNGASPVGWRPGSVYLWSRTGIGGSLVRARIR